MKIGYLLLFIVSFVLGQIRITEIMYDLDGSDSPNEFVEIFNLSETDSVDLTGWQIKDKYSTDDLVDSGYGLIIPPQSYGIIFEGDYNFIAGIYAGSTPPGVVLLKVDDSSIGNGLSTSDSLFLISDIGAIEDSFGWTDTADDGFSLEKVRVELPNTPSNWSQSLDSLGTPGSINSVEPLEIDGILLSDSMTVSPVVADSGETVTIYGYAGNIGRTSFSGEIEIRENDNILESISLPQLNELDTTEFSAVVGPFSSGSHEVQVKLLVTNDGNETNNSGTVTVGVRYPVRLLTINEFLPRPKSGEPEFVELYYHGVEAQSLSGWGISDQSGNPVLMQNVDIMNTKYIVVAADSSLFSRVPDSSLFLTPTNNFPILNNSGDAIRIYDPFGTIIDSLTYHSGWGYEMGQSMEKVFLNYASSDSVSWLPAVDPDGMTPGRRNSVMPWLIDGAMVSSMIIYTPRIPAHSDSIRLVIPVINLGQNAFPADLYVEYDEDELASTGLMVSNPGDTVFAILTLPPLPPGEHELFTAIDILNDGNPLNNSGTIIIQIRYPFGTIKLNEFMARPNNDQSEFVEVVSFDEFAMFSWSIGDNSLQKKTLPDIPVYFGDYIVIAADSTLYPLQNEDAHFLVPQNGWTSLNNSGDAIYLYDLTGSIIDSLKYNTDWPLVDETSSEKLRPEFDSSSPYNWEIAIHHSGATPGFANSVTLFDLDGAMITDSIRHEPLYPANDETIIIYPMFTNSGVTSFSGEIIISVDGEEYGTSLFSEIAPRDTAIIGMEFGPLISGPHFVNLSLSISGDQNSSNDAGYDSVLVSYDFGAVVLNEFLSIPDSFQTEFVELVVQEPVIMNNWSISDNSFSKKIFSFGSIESGTYLVLAGDSLMESLTPDNINWIIPNRGLPGLNNTSDGIYLYDMTGMLIDSLIYTDGWKLIENRSMEKYRPELISNDSSKWAVAVNESGQTPGKNNSVYYKELAKEGSLILEPNPFSPDGDSFDDLLYIKYKLPFEYAIISIQIFDVIGRTIAAPYWNVYTSQENVLTWNGKRDNGDSARIGIYIIKTRAKDTSSGKTWEDVQTVVLAKKL